jgi:hypothetical protein
VGLSSQENAHTTSFHSNGKQMARGYTRTTPSAKTWLLVYPWQTAALQKLNTYQWRAQQKPWDQ